MSKSIKVSVIIPAYNEEKYIVDCLQAISNQDYDNYEVIVVDNASSDHTSMVVRNFILEHPSINIKLLYESKKGTNHAREAARNAATGDIIAQLDADCLPNYKWVSNGVNILQTNGVVAATGAYYYYDGNAIVRLLSLISQIITYPIINTIVQISNRGAILIGGNAFVFASILENAGGYNTNLTFYGDDVDVANRIAKFGWINYSSKLILNSSYRRFNKLGFWKVNKKYQDFFWNIVLRRKIGLESTIELIHPR